MKIPLGSCKLYAKRIRTYLENQQNEIFKIKDYRCAKYALEKRAHPTATGLDS